VPDAVPRLRAALEWLVRGPTTAEGAAGIRSWFSEKTAGSLREVEVDTTGRAVVDFHDLRPLIPNASSSFGSTMLLQELNGTVFQFPEIRSVEYRMEGSCDLFWEWLQYGCRVVARPVE
jgi:spore germination protein GerM